MLDAQVMKISPLIYISIPFFYSFKPGSRLSLSSRLDILSPSALSSQSDAGKTSSQPGPSSIPSSGGRGTNLHLPVRPSLKRPGSAKTLETVDDDEGFDLLDGLLDGDDESKEDPAQDDHARKIQKLDGHAHKKSKIMDTTNKNTDINSTIQSIVPPARKLHPLASAITKPSLQKGANPFSRSTDIAPTRVTLATAVPPESRAIDSTAMLQCVLNPAAAFKTPSSATTLTNMALAQKPMSNRHLSTAPVPALPAVLRTSIKGNTTVRLKNLSTRDDVDDDDDDFLEPAPRIIRKAVQPLYKKPGPALHAHTNNPSNKSDSGAAGLPLKAALGSIRGINSSKAQLNSELSMLKSEPTEQLAHCHEAPVEHLQHNQSTNKAIAVDTSVSAPSITAACKVPAGLPGVSAGVVKKPTTQRQFQRPRVNPLNPSQANHNGNLDNKTQAPEESQDPSGIVPLEDVEIIDLSGGSQIRDPQSFPRPAFTRPTVPPAAPRVIMNRNIHENTMSAEGLFPDFRPCSDTAVPSGELGTHDGTFRGGLMSAPMGAFGGKSLTRARAMNVPPPRIAIFDHRPFDHQEEEEKQPWREEEESHELEEEQEFEERRYGARDNYRGGGGGDYEDDYCEYEYNNPDNNWGNDNGNTSNQYYRNGTTNGTTNAPGSNRSPADWTILALRPSGIANDSTAVRSSFAVNDIDRRLHNAGATDLESILERRGGITIAEGSTSGNRTWWYRLPDLVPVAVLQSGRNPRDGSQVFIDYKNQFSGKSGGGATAEAKRAARAAGVAARAAGGGGSGGTKRQSKGEMGAADKGYWVTIDGQKMYIDAKGKELTGRAAYNASLKESGKTGSSGGADVKRKRKKAGGGGKRRFAKRSRK